MSDYESTSPTQTRPTDLDSDKTSGPTVVESVVGVASASPPLLRSEQARQKRRGSLSHLRRGLIAAAALIGSVTGLYIGSYNQKLWMRDLLKGATYPPS